MDDNTRNLLEALEVINEEFLYKNTRKYNIKKALKIVYLFIRRVKHRIKKKLYRLYKILSKRLKKLCHIITLFFKLLFTCNFKLLKEKVYNEIEDEKLKKERKATQENITNQKRYNNKAEQNLLYETDIEQKTYEIDTKQKKKIVIYTCIIDNYDQIQEPLIKEKNVRYVLFTDDKNIKKTNWEILPIPSDIKKYKNPILINRYIKMNPHKIFKGYDYAFYVDGNIKLISQITSLINYINPKTGIAIHRHKNRDCLYQEINRCIKIGRGNKKELRIIKKQFAKEKVPEHFGLWECNFFVVNLHNSLTIKILNEWWDYFYKSNLLRDQIPFAYILWKNNINPNDLGIIGNNVTRNPKFRVIKHKK